jgi:hypothetical protein
MNSEQIYLDGTEIYGIEADVWATMGWQAKFEVVRDILEEAEARNQRTYCAFCGHEEPIDGDGSLITKHIQTCDKHPMQLVEIQLTAANDCCKSYQNRIAELESYASEMAKTQDNLQTKYDELESLVTKSCGPS